MATRRFYVTDCSASTLELDAEQTAHARKSLRLAVGDTVELFDGRGTVATGAIIALGRTMRVELAERHTVEPPRPKLTLACAVPKGDRAATLVEAATQLGVDRLAWLVTARSVVEPRPAKQARFERIAIEAAKQCGRAWLMPIDPPAPLAHVLAEPARPGELRLMADVQDLHAGPTRGDGSSNINAVSAVSAVTALVGPEGGWTDAERTDARAAGYDPWRLGPHTLRVETAALAAAAIVRAAAFFNEPGR